MYDAEYSARPSVRRDDRPARCRLLASVLLPATVFAMNAEVAAMARLRAGADQGEDSPAAEAMPVPSTRDSALAGALATVAFGDLFDTSDFPPRWHCGVWTPVHGWFHIVADLGTWIAYTCIPICIVYVIRKQRDVPFPRIFWLFGTFILACGLTHLFEAMMFWWPAYRLMGVVKVGTALVSLATVVALIPILPQAVRLPGIRHLHEQLTRELEHRERAESALRAHTAETEKRNDALERFSRHAVGRELRMVELKREVNELAQRLGETPRYRIAADSELAGVSHEHSA